MPGIAALVLAAGASTRMGQPKQLLSYASEPLVRRAARVVVDAGFAPVLVVTGRDHAAIEPLLRDLPVRCVQNPDWERGIGTSIRAGLAAVPGGVEGVLIHLADQPLVDAEALRGLLGAWRRSGRPVAVSAWGNEIGPPVVSAATLFPELLDLPDAAGAKALWANRPERVERFPCPAAAHDIDTPGDFAALPVVRQRS